METEYNNQLPTGIIINGQALTSAEVLAVARHYAHVALGDESISCIRAARAVIDTISAENQKVYGVTTGFGHLSRVRIPQDQLEELQHNLLRSHAGRVVVRRLEGGERRARHVGPRHREVHLGE